MGRGTKIAVGIGSAIVLLCVCAFVAGFIGLRFAGQLLSQSVVDTPAEVERIATKITDYDLPPGYNEEFGMDLFGYTMVGFNSRDQDSVIMMMQFPGYLNLSQAEMEKQMQQQAQGKTSNLASSYVPEGQTQVTIRGQEVTLSYSRGVSKDGEDIRQVIGFFTGKQGMSLLMIVGSVAEWDQESLDYFIASLR